MNYPYGAIRVEGEPDAVNAVIAKAKKFNGTSVSDIYNNGDKESANIVAHANYLGELGDACKRLGAYYSRILPMINHYQVENSVW